jgi:hypothetical protein
MFPSRSLPVGRHCATQCHRWCCGGVRWLPETRSAAADSIPNVVPDGVVETPSGTMRLRGWYGAHVHEWATYRHSETRAYVRRDLVLLWRNVIGYA